MLSLNIALSFLTVSTGAPGSGRLLDVDAQTLAAIRSGQLAAVSGGLPDDELWRWSSASIATADNIRVCNPTANGANPGRFILDADVIVADNAAAAVTTNIRRRSTLVNPLAINNTKIGITCFANDSTGGGTPAVAGNYASALGGDQPTVTGNHATVCGGLQIGATAQRVFMGGGVGNTGSADTATCCGGSGLTVSGTFGFAGGGASSSVTGTFGTCCGGVGHTVGDRGFVGGGDTNVATGKASGVPSGDANSATATYSGVASGFGGTASASGAAVTGGAGGIAKRISERVHSFENAGIVVGGLFQLPEIGIYGNTPGSGVGESVNLMYGDVAEITLDNVNTYFVEFCWTACAANGSVRCGGRLTGTVKCEGGAVTIVGQGAIVTEQYTEAGAATWTMTMVASAQKLRFTFTTGATTTAAVAGGVVRLVQVNRTLS